MHNEHVRGKLRVSKHCVYIIINNPLNIHILSTNEKNVLEIYTPDILETEIGYDYSRNQEGSYFKGLFTSEESLFLEQPTEEMDFQISDHTRSPNDNDTGPDIQVPLSNIPYEETNTIIHDIPLTLNQSQMGAKETHKKEKIQKKKDTSTNKKRERSDESLPSHTKARKTSFFSNISMDKVNKHNFYYWMNIVIQENKNDIMNNTCKMLLCALEKDIIHGKEAENIKFIQHMLTVKNQESLKNIMDHISNDKVHTLESLTLEKKTRTKIISLLRTLINNNDTNPLHIGEMSYLIKQSSDIKKRFLYYNLLFNHLPKRLKGIVEEKMGEILNDFYMDSCYTNTCN